MDPIKVFTETAPTYGIGVGVLLAVVAGMLWIIWRIGTRLTDSHEAYLQSTAEELKKQTTVLNDIKARLPSVCQAQCPAQPSPPARAPRLRPSPNGQ